MAVILALSVCVLSTSSGDCSCAPTSIAGSLTYDPNGCVPVTFEFRELPQDRSPGDCDAASCTAPEEPCEFQLEAHFDATGCPGPVPWGWTEVDDDGNVRSAGGIHWRLPDADGIPGGEFRPFDVECDQSHSVTFSAGAYGKTIQILCADCAFG